MPSIETKDLPQVRAAPLERERKETLKREDATQRIENYMGHSFEMLHQMKQQAWLEAQNLPADKLGEALEKLDMIYHNAESKLTEIQTNINNRRGDHGIYSNNANGHLAPHLDSTDIVRETKRFAEDLDAAQKEIVMVIQNANIEVVTVFGLASVPEAKGISSSESSTFKKKIGRLAAGGLGARWTRLMALVFKVDRVAIEVFKVGKAKMEEAANNRFENAPPKATTTVDQEKLDKFRSKEKQHRIEIERRANVIGVAGIYSIGVSFSTKVIQKQFSSFSAQHLSDRERTTIVKEFQIGQSSFTSRQTPLNKEFDTMLGNITTFFGTLFGNKGISSMNREEGHLIDAFDSKLVNSDGKIIFDCLRHAGLSEKHEKNPEIRKQKSEQAAKELLTAALLKEIKSRGLPIDDPQVQNITLNLNSVSLVTPDIYRRILHGKACEREILEDQLKAFEALRGENVTLSIGEKTITVKVNINAFNFGVNQGAVNFHIALAHQHKTNLKAFEGLESDVKEFLKDHPNEEMSKLLDDVRALMKDKKAYLEGRNQYEIGAKILILTNLMQQNKEADDSKGYQCATNCMSGKDRTGLMDAVAKTFAIMASKNNGHYPTHKELMDRKKREEFTKIFKSVLMEGGGMDITELNTGARGYKVGPEASLYGILDLDLVKGFSESTKG